MRNHLIFQTRPNDVRRPTERGLVTLRIARADRTITPTLLTGQYEKAELDILESLLEPGMTVIDVGSNNGVYTCVSSRLVGQCGRVISIEPISENLEALNESISLNLPATANVTVIPAASGAEADTVRIYPDDDNTGTHSASGRGDRWEDVAVRSIDERIQSVVPTDEAQCAKFRNSNLVVVPPERAQDVGLIGLLG